MAAPSERLEMLQKLEGLFADRASCLDMSIHWEQNGLIAGFSASPEELQVFLAAPFVQ